MLTTAAKPLTTQFSCVWRMRPMPIASTLYPEYAAVAKQRIGTASAARAKWGLRASMCTIHGASEPSASESQHVTKSRYVSTYEYVRLASRSSLIEYAKAGQASWNAVITKMIT